MNKLDQVWSALESGCPSDPLEIVASYGNCRLAEWRLIAMSTGLTVFAHGSPFDALLFCYDRGSERECAAFDMNGKELVRVLGPRKAKETPQEQYSGRFIEGLLGTVERIRAQKPTSEGR